MFLESLTLTSFRCFGPTTTTIAFRPGTTAFVGANGSGKTAVLQALLRLFGMTAEQRRVRRQDFHVPAAEAQAPRERLFSVEAVFAFPDLEGEDDEGHAAPAFFHQMSCMEDGAPKCRLRLEGRWTDDGSLDGAIEQAYQVVRTQGPRGEPVYSDLRQSDRALVQVVYVPATRDGSSQVTAFLRGRLWRAVTWTVGVKEALAEAGQRLNAAFGREGAVAIVSEAVDRRWREIHAAGTDTTPSFRPVDMRFQQFIRRVEVAFSPDEAGRDRALEELSDGQRSLFHLAMTAAALDVEAAIAGGAAGAAFAADAVPLPALTLIALEEPENNLAPFYLSRIVGQVEDLTKTGRAQAFVSSHSASILARIDPAGVRHFRIVRGDRTARVRPIRLPAGDEEGSKFIREAVRAYPELYFARFAILGEGASEEAVLPRLAEAIGMPIDRSFVAIVPLGGRHVNHLWRLLSDLAIPHATLLDLDLGREGGGWGRIKTALEQLLACGVRPRELFEADEAHDVDAVLTTMARRDARDRAGIDEWTSFLRRQGVFFSAPLDLDYSMLAAFPEAYRAAEPGRRGPAGGDAREAVLGERGMAALYGPDDDDAMRWYRYLFLGRGKPGTHVRVLSGLEDDDLLRRMPEELRALLDHVAEELGIELPRRRRR